MEIENLENASLQPYIFTKLAEIYWLNRLLAKEEIPHRPIFLGLLQTSLFAVINYAHVYNLHDDNINFEAILKVQKEIIDIDPDDEKKFLAIANTCIALQRYK